MGDKGAVKAIELEQRVRQSARQLEAQGMDAAEARQLAQKTAELEQFNTQGSNQRTNTVIADSARAIGLGGNAFADMRKPQEEMVRAQSDANILLGDIKTLLSKQGPRVLLAETFD